jgi:ABC-type antimicrobial peptide transport system permease subunit
MKILSFIKNTPHNLVALGKFIIKISSFILLLNAYLMMHAVIKVTNMRFFPHALAALILKPSTKLYDLAVSTNRKSEHTINRVNLIELSLKNMRFKFTRTIITIGGMSVGIAAIVFLVSLGYGVEKLVTTRVARLEELKQADVQPQPGSNIKLNDKTLSDFGQLPNVKTVLPVIALVGKVNYKNSVSDMAVYGVTTEYLNQSAIKPVQGKIFKSDEISKIIPTQYEQAGENVGSVAGASIVRHHRFLEQIRKVQFQLNPDAWLTVREKPSTTAKVLGYTKRTDKMLFGNEVYGLAYKGSDEGNVAVDQEGEDLGKWISAEFLLWKPQGGKYAEDTQGTGENLEQKTAHGYIAQIETDVNSAESTAVDEKTGEVLGISAMASNGNTINMSALLESNPTELQTVAGESTQSTGSNIVELDDNWVILSDETAAAKEAEKTKTVKMPPKAQKEAVVNRAMLKVLGINENEAVGKEFETSFVVTSALLANPELSIKSEPTKYKIVGIIPQDDTPFFYVPFLDLRQLGVTNYSQVKVVSGNKENLADIRQRIEASGFGTSSVVDTVAQIGTLFNTIRKVLALVGAVALTVAALGMFNTLTVSLLERTREIGLMKAMGMKSHEVQELFLTESMVMGVFGGVLGLGFGWLAGKGISLILSSVAMFKGVGMVNISHIPFSFILLIMALSVTVGVLTGLYPARRATRISALNALRYE